MTRKSFNRLKKEGYVSEIKVEPRTIASLTQEYFQTVAQVGEKSYHLAKLSQEKEQALSNLTKEIQELMVKIDGLQAEGAKLRAEEAKNNTAAVTEAEVSNVVPIHPNISEADQVGNAG